MTSNVSLYVFEELRLGVLSLFLVVGKLEQTRRNGASIQPESLARIPREVIVYPDLEEGYGPGMNSHKSSGNMVHKSLNATDYVLLCQMNVAAPIILPKRGTSSPLS